MNNNKINFTFSSNLIYLRTICGFIKIGKPFTQEILADKLNTSLRTIYNWERGHVPSRTNLKKIADFFTKCFGVEITPEDLLYRDMRNIITIKAQKEIVINEEELGKIKLLRDFEIFARENLTEKDIETLIKIAKLLKERGEL